MAMQPALGDVSCELRDVETANLTEGWLEVLARTYTFGFAVRAGPTAGARRIVDRQPPPDGGLRVRFRITGGLS